MNARRRYTARYVEENGEKKHSLCTVRMEELAYGSAIAFTVSLIYALLNFANCTRSLLRRTRAHFASRKAVYVMKSDFRIFVRRKITRARYFHSLNEHHLTQIHNATRICST